MLTGCAGLTCNQRTTCRRYVIQQTGKATDWYAKNACLPQLYGPPEIYFQHWRPNMTIHLVPIEPIELRYSAEWIKWFDDYLVMQENLNYIWYEPYLYLDSGTCSKINHGQFLDVIDTNLYKNSQLRALITAIRDDKIKDGDTILFFDGWFPGIEALAYIRDAMKKKIKFVAMFHAGTYDPHDYLTACGMRSWSADLENSWLNIYDKVIVSTFYHKNLLLTHTTIPTEKLEIIFFPMAHPVTSPSQLLAYKKPHTIVFPHRNAPEKQPELFTILEQQLKIYNFPYQFMTTHQYTEKSNYFKTLSEAQFSISFALQETWGIAMIESVLHGCIPLVPDRLSYTELYPQLFKFTGSDDGMIEVLNAIQHIQKFQLEIDYALDRVLKLREQFIALGKQAIPAILNTCLRVAHHD